MLKITGGSVIISILIQACCIVGYYSTYLWLNPDDPGRKQFYNQKSSPSNTNSNTKSQDKFGRFQGAVNFFF